MAPLYPVDWRFVVDDAFLFARRAAAQRHSWDLVSADLPSDLPLEMVEALPLWWAIADRFVVSTICRHNFPGEPNMDDLPEPPQGWYYANMIQRSEYRGGMWWLVSERAPS